jgi:predicted RNA methylase
MPEQSPAHTDRVRAESFGAAADDYDRHRPRYPRPLVADLITREGVQALDVGAGTGIAAMQLAQAGAQVLAIEPDERMALVAKQYELDEINADYLDVAARPIVNAEEEATALIKKCGFSVELRRIDEPLHYTTDHYLNLVSTYSNRLRLDPAAQAELRSRLAQRIGTAGVDAQNNALAVVCTPTGAR